MSSIYMRSNCVQNYNFSPFLNEILNLFLKIKSVGAFILKIMDTIKLI